MRPLCRNSHFRSRYWRVDECKSGLADELVCIRLNHLFFACVSPVTNAMSLLSIHDRRTLCVSNDTLHCVEYLVSQFWCICVIPDRRVLRACCSLVSLSVSRVVTSLIRLGLFTSSRMLCLIFRFTLCLISGRLNHPATWSRSSFLLLPPPFIHPIKQCCHMLLSRFFGPVT